MSTPRIHWLVIGLIWATVLKAEALKSRSYPLLAYDCENPKNVVKQQLPPECLIKKPTKDEDSITETNT